VPADSTPAFPGKPGGWARRRRGWHNARVLLTRVLILSLGLAASASTQESSEGAPVEARAAMEEYLRGCEAFGFSGAVLVAREGEVVLRSAYGTQGDEPLTPEHRFELGELAQWFTAVAVLRLADRGTWRLLDPLADHLEGVLNVHRRITLRQLLSHTSGMSRFGPTVEDTGVAAAVGRHLSVRPAFTAGTRVQPWDGGYALLAAALENVTGEPFEDFVEREVFATAGMSSAFFRGRVSDAPAPLSRARGTGEPAGTGVLHWGLRGARGVVAGVDDLFRFDRALAAGELLTADSRARSMRAVRSGFALGAWSRPTSGGRATVWRGGREPGFESEFWRFPDDGACLAVLTNRSDGAADAVSRNLAALLFGEEPPLPLPPRVYSGEAEFAAVGEADHAAAGEADFAAVGEADFAALGGDYGLETGGALRFEWTGTAMRVRGLDPAGHDLLFTGSLLTSLDRFDGEKESALGILEELAADEGARAREAGLRVVEEGLWGRARAQYRAAAERVPEGAEERAVEAVTSVGSGRVRVLVRHGGGAARAADWFSALTFAGGLWVDFEVDVDPDVVVRIYQPTAADTLSSFDYFKARAPSFRAEWVAGRVELVVETPSGRSARARREPNIAGGTAYEAGAVADPR